MNLRNKRVVEESDGEDVLVGGEAPLTNALDDVDEEGDGRGAAEEVAGDEVVTGGEGGAEEGRVEEEGGDDAPSNEESPRSKRMRLRQSMRSAVNDGEIQEEDTSQDGNNGEVLDEEGGRSEARKVRRGIPRVRIGQGESHAVRLTQSTASVVLKFNVNTAVLCPCAENCGNYIRVGRFAVLGDGSDGCPHCGKRRMTKFGTATQFKGGAEILRHLQTADCLRSRNITNVRKNYRAILGEDLCHDISAPTNRTNNELGRSAGEFNCPKCKKKCPWGRRFKHVVECYPKHGVLINPR